MMMEYSSTLEVGESDNQQQQDKWRQHRMQCRKSALESSTGILQLALTEFSGCALLHLYYLESLADYIYHSEGLHCMNAQNGVVGMEVDDRRAARNNLAIAFERTWESVGRGTHVNEGVIVSEIYRLHGSYLLFNLSSSVIDHLETNVIMNQLSELFQRWSKTPMGEGSNDEMLQDMEYFWEEACSLLLSQCEGGKEQLNRKHALDQQRADIWERIDDERKKMSPLTNVLSSYENEIDVAMSNEGIALPRQTIFHQLQEQPKDNDDFGRYVQSLKKSSAKWSHILLDDTHRFLLGFGANETSRAFLKTISFLQRIYLDMMKREKAVNIADCSPVEYCIAAYRSSFIISMYERAVSECPTVEQLWTSYMNFLNDEWTRRRKQIMEQKQENTQHNDELMSTLQSVSHRAVRNCPYSCVLFEVRMTTLGLITASNLDPDDIHAVIKEATDLGFLTCNRESMLHLRLVAILVVKRRLLGLISLGTTVTPSMPGKDYDDSEVIDTSGQNSHSLSSTDMEEVRDLLEDIRDMYEEVDTYLFNSHPSWSEGKAAFCKSRALTEAYVLCPVETALSKTLHGDDEIVEDDSTAINKKAMLCFEKWAKAQKPSHPDSWREYIKYAMQSQPLSIAETASSFRKIRGLYNRAMSSVKKACQETAVAVENRQSWMGTGTYATLVDRDYDTSLVDLCREYLEFERNYGSVESLSHAQTQVRSKLMNRNLSVTSTAPIPQIEDHTVGKRKLENDNVATESLVANGEDDEVDKLLPKRAKVKTDLKQPKKTDGVHKVRIGKLDYPAHPFTIHVSKLSKDTQDMDLVDAFNHDFGAVVHAKILREKLTGKGGHHYHHHYHGESKCCGLVQFEERASVETALQKDGQLEIGGKLVKIQRSHLPAVGLVPAGMHRVNPKGEGKMSKRNELKKSNADSATGKGAKDNAERMDIEDDGRGNNKQERVGIHGTTEKLISAKITSPSSLSFGVLSLKPTHIRPKPKISFDSKTK